jgi:hypothetical protein
MSAASIRWWSLAFLLTLGVAACELESHVPVRLPQVEAVQRAVNEPREERSAAYVRCLDQALAGPGRDQQELVQCMKEAGFGFLARSAQHRESACREALESPDELPPSFCFQKLD